LIVKSKIFEVNLSLLAFGDEQGSNGGAEYGTLLVTRFKDQGI
jgi:hypothetical protein